MTERKSITCPDTGHLEEVELERTRLGLVVTGCSRFLDAPLACARECARRMDRRDRCVLDDRERVLLVVPTLHDDAARVATMVAEELAGDGVSIDIVQLDGRGVPPLADYDAAVIGADVQLGRNVIEYIRSHLAELSALPTYFYSVGGQAAFPHDSHARRMTRRTGWEPASSWTFVDASASQRADARAFARLVADELPRTMQTTG